MPLDIASIRLIEQRQRAANWPRIVRGGLGEMQSFDALAKMQTNAQARGVPGIAAKWLQQGFGILDTFPFVSGDAKRQAQSLLDRTNAYAQKVYATLPDNAGSIEPAVRKRVVIAVNQAATNLKLVSSVRDNLNQGLLTDIVNYLQSGLSQFIDDTIERTTGKKFHVELPRILIWTAVGAVGLGILFVTAKLVHTAVLGGAALEEAEMTAMALADAAKRKRSNRRVVSIS